jgi:hypothetical protein
MLVGVLTGVFVCAKTSTSTTILYVQNFPLRLVLIHKISSFTFIFLEVLLFFVTLLLVHFLSFFRFGRVLIVAMLVYFSYIFGVDVTVIFISFGALRGVIFSMVGVFIFEASALFIIFVYSFKQICFNREYMKFGNCFIRDYEFKILLSNLLLLAIITILQGIAIFILTKIFVF